MIKLDKAINYFFSLLGTGIVPKYLIWEWAMPINLPSNFWLIEQCQRSTVIITEEEFETFYDDFNKTDIIYD